LGSRTRPRKAPEIIAELREKSGSRRGARPLDGFEDGVERGPCLSEVRFADLGAQGVRPRSLPGFDRLNRGAAVGLEAQQLAPVPT
jgi:hypothetical protein